MPPLELLDGEKLRAAPKQDLLRYQAELLQEFERAKAERRRARAEKAERILANAARFGVDETVQLSALQLAAAFALVAFPPLTPGALIPLATGLGTMALVSWRRRRLFAEIAEAARRYEDATSRLRAVVDAMTALRDETRRRFCEGEWP